MSVFMFSCSTMEENQAQQSRIFFFLISNQQNISKIFPTISNVKN